MSACFINLVIQKKTLAINYCLFFRECIRLRNNRLKGTLPIVEPKQKGLCPLQPLPTEQIINISDDDDETYNQMHADGEWVFIITKIINKVTPDRRNNRLKGMIPIYKK